MNNNTNANWSCTECTLSNEAGEHKCGVCDAIRPTPKIHIPQNILAAPIAPLGQAVADGSGGFTAELDVTTAAGLLIKRGHHLQEQWGVRMNYQKDFADSQMCMLRISSLDQDMATIALQGIQTILADPVAWKESLSKTKLHVFVDDSNVFYGGINQCAEDEFMDMKALLRVVQQGRWTEELVVVGSGTGGESRWRAYDNAGYTKHVLPRGADGCEVGVDDTLLSLVQRETDKQFTDLSNRRLVVVTGDGNDNMGRVSFPDVVQSALRKGWSVEVWSWDKGMSAKWRSKGGAGGSGSDSDEPSFESMYSGTGQFNVMSLNNHRDSIIRRRTPEQQQQRLAMKSPRGVVSPGATSPRTVAPPPGFTELAAGDAGAGVALNWQQAMLSKRPFVVSPPSGNTSPGGRVGSHTTSRGPDGTHGFRLARSTSKRHVSHGGVTASATATTANATGGGGGRWRSRSALAAAAAGSAGSAPPSTTGGSSWRSKSIGAEAPKSTLFQAYRGSTLESLAADAPEAPKSALFQAYCPPCQSGSVAPSSLTSAQCAVCKDWLSFGSCSFGDRCHFQHPGKEGIGLGGKHLCGRWAGTGRCDLGDSCTFAHPPICRFGADCVPQRHGCKCKFFHPNPSAARAATQTAASGRMAPKIRVAPTMRSSGSIRASGIPSGLMRSGSMLSTTQAYRPPHSRLVCAQ